jgi:hypothetical protein
MVCREEANVTGQSSMQVCPSSRSLLLVSSGVLKRYEKESPIAKLRRRILKQWSREGRGL